MEALARLCVRFRWVVLAAWVVLVVGLSALSGIAAGDVSDDFALPGSDSQQAVDILEKVGFEAAAGTTAQVVLHSTDGVDAPTVRAAVGELVDAVSARLPEADMVSPFQPGGERQISSDGETAYVAVALPEIGADEVAATMATLDEVRADVDVPGLQVEVGGLLVEEESEGGPPPELIGIIAAMAVLLIAFGSLLATVMPIAVGVVGAACGTAVVGLAAHVVEMPSFAAPVAAMIAIGVGIDYALLVVTRYREALADGIPPTGAVSLAQATAGRSVLFAGTIVVVASLGLVLMGLKLITGVALGIAAAVLLTMLAALTFLPALLGFTREGIDRFGLPHRRKGRDDSTVARRWSRQIQRHPLPWAAGAFGLLVVLSLPALDMRLGFADAGNRSPDDTARRAYDLLADGFGPGVNGPLVVAIELSSSGQAAVVDDLRDAVATDAGVAATSAPVVSDAGTTALIHVVPTTAPKDAGTTELVHRLRDDVVPGVVEGTGTAAAVGGMTAAAVDFADYTAERLPLFLSVVLGLSFVLLMVVFRGVLIAVKAVVVNLLSIGAALGAVVAVFQWGWGVQLLDLGGSAPVEAWAPMMLIAIVFGLSMDYEVFLLSRVREEYDRLGDNATAVSEGLAKTARVITAAAAIMVCVFGSFVLGPSRELQLFGFGLAFAVLIDATVVRMVLVPATMELLGDRNWWLPRWLDRHLPHLAVDASSRSFPQTGVLPPSQGAALTRHN